MASPPGLLRASTPVCLQPCRVQTHRTRQAFQACYVARVFNARTAGQRRRS